MNALPHFLLAALVLAAPACSSKKDDPQATPAPDPNAPNMTYTDASGVHTLTALHTVRLSGPPLNGKARTSMNVSAELPSGQRLTLTYTYQADRSPSFAVAAYPLDDAVMVTPAATGVPYKSAVGTTATLNSESATADIIGGTYTGPTVTGGPSISVKFTKLPVPL